MKLERRAFAKINLVLEVLRRLPDGYHQIASVMQTIDLGDTIRLSPDSQITLVCSDSSLAGESNLVWRVALALREASGTAAGARIELEKRIPLAAGLGGGSSDAAATLLGLNELWGLGWEREKLARLGAELGLDIPFFVYGGTALVEGKGERVTPLQSPPVCSIVLVRPALFLPAKTASLYRRLDPADFSDGSRTADLVRFIAEGGRLSRARLFNVFERVVFEDYAVVRECRDKILQAGANEVHLSGSGPTLFSLMEDEGEAALVAEQLETEGLEVYLCRTVS
jgi:4-diphosphocytidyl-2-C-methyl-D-erythritol kinase